MKRNTIITIPQPCRENWNNMTPSQKGRFCSNCEKTVHDFTKATDREIREKLDSGQNICGRFLVSQLNREMVVTSEKSNLWSVAATGVLGLLSANADGQTNGEKTAKSEISFTEMQSQASGKKQLNLSPADKINIIEGDVRDETGQLPGATIVNIRTKEKVTSDLNGIFIIKACEGDILEADFVGMHTSKMVVNFTKKPVIQMTEKYMLGNSMITFKKEENEITVTGVVSDDEGVLPGANIVVKGRPHGVVADIDGRYSITAKQNDTLVFSFIGTESKEIAVKKNIDVILKMNVALRYVVLGEVVVRRSFVRRTWIKIGNLFRSEENDRY